MRLPANDVFALETAILADEGIRFEAFRKVMGIRLPGTRRALRMQMHRHAVSAVDTVGIRMSFTLPAGGYATVVLDEVRSDLEFSRFPADST